MLEEGADSTGVKETPEQARSRLERAALITARSMRLMPPGAEGEGARLIAGQGLVELDKQLKELGAA